MATCCSFARRTWLALALLAQSLAPLAWDVERMSQAAQRLGPQAVQAVRVLQPLLVGLAEADDAARLDGVNRFFNRRIVFREDIEVWHVEDYWASPLETLQQGMGDCEDFAIAKYFSLLATGMPASQLRLVYVRLQVGGPQGPSQPHMVLAYYASAQAEPLILDNLVTEIRPASRRPDLTPVFSFNSEGLWQGNGAQRMGDPVERLSPWRDVLRKARAEGFL
ncbi:MAG TPA: transglutaminase-like cysteine peptidase [Burkholderiaceae bacterium]|nr:transglutaminase-like cysteine peptidase [Burkholderiaceae bacterium]